MQDCLYENVMKELWSNIIIIPILQVYKHA